MNGLGSPRLLPIVILVACGLVACSPHDEPAPRPAPQAMPAPAQATTPPAPAAPAPAPALQGVIAGSGSAPPVALLAEAGKRPVLVPEGASFGEDIRVERVMPDHVVLRRKGDSLPIALPLTTLPGVTATVADWENHLTTLFPEVRLKRILEMRGADAGSRAMTEALPALVAGQVYPNPYIAMNYSAQAAAMDTLTGYLTSAKKVA